VQFRIFAFGNIKVIFGKGAQVISVFDRVSRRYSRLAQRPNADRTTERRYRTS